MTENDRRMNDPGGDIALYVHWPFCLSLCPYCDFNSHVRETIDQGAWRDGLLRELEHYAARVPARDGARRHRASPGIVRARPRN